MKTLVYFENTKIVLGVSYSRYSAVGTLAPKIDVLKLFGDFEYLLLIKCSAMLSFDPVFTDDAQCAETNEISIFRVMG